MSEISQISGPKLTSQVKVSFESTQKMSPLESSSQMEGIKEFELEMAQIKEAFASVDQIRRTLEQALKDLSPNG